MWLWGVRTTSMERIGIDLIFFEEYRNHQVILNYYAEDDFLSKREGFHFTSIKVDHNQIIFKRKQGAFIVSLEEFPSVSKNHDFPNYYTFYELNLRLEMYFP
jgi:transposase